MARKRPKVGDPVRILTGWAKGLVGRVTAREDHGDVFQVTIRAAGETVVQRYPYWSVERLEKGA